MLVGVLGLGSIGDRHARNLMNLGHQVVFHDPVVLGSMERDQVIKMSDAVIVCTPTKQHGRDLCDVLDARKHVLVEKPIGYDCPPYIAGYIMGARSEKPDLVVATGFNLRFHHCVKKVKQLIDGGFIGDLKEADFRVLQKNNKPEYLRDGVIRNWASHEIDLARHLLGNLHVELCNVNMLGPTSKQDVSAYIQMVALDMNEASVSVSADYLKHPEDRGFSIRSEDNMILCDLVKREVSWGPAWDFSGKEDHEAKFTDTFDENYIDEMKAFINAIEGKDRGPLADGSDGVAALQIVMDARKKAGLDD